MLGFHRKLTALALCKSVEPAIQWFQIHHKITFATIQHPAVYLSAARVSIFFTLVPRQYITLLSLSFKSYSHGWASAELPQNRVNVNVFLRQNKIGKTSAYFLRFDIKLMKSRSEFDLVTVLISK